MTRRRTAAWIATLAALAAAGFLSAMLFVSPLRSTFWEQITGETPEAKMATYVRAVARGDEQGAVNVWELPGWELPSGRSAILTERRRNVTRDLIAAGIGPGFTMLCIEWWRTCCEPGVTEDPRGAGGARVRVQLRARDGTPLLYVFDVFDRDGAYWGAALDYPPRRWALRDVYRDGDQPLFWQFGRN